MRRWNLMTFAVYTIIFASFVFCAFAVLGILAVVVAGVASFR